MIDRFNFYDIYGYFLPGATFLAILCLPFGLVRNWWPSTTWASAIIAVAFAYVLGHLIQGLATNALPSKIKGRNGKPRNPSELYLDQTNEVLPKELKEKIALLIEKQFNLKLEIEKEGEDTVDHVRNNAFLLARQMLIQGRAVGYAEQFEGMYALMRGLACVLAFGACYWIGWSAVALGTGPVTTGAAILVLAGLLAALASLSVVLLGDTPNSTKKHKIEAGYTLVLLAGFLAVGYVLGTRFPPAHSQGGSLAFFGILALLGSLRAFRAYKFFATQFATSVWRDFLSYHAATALRAKPDSEAAK